MQRKALGTDKSVSDMLSALELSGQTWCYSDVGQDAGFSVPPYDGVSFHAVLHGRVRIACVSEGTFELGAGDALMLLSGEAHAIRTNPASTVRTHDFLREDRRVDVPPSLAIGSGPASARMLSGKLHVSWPGEVSRTTLPSLLPLRQGEGGALAMLRAEALPLAGIGPGSAALLTQLAALILVASLRGDPRCRALFTPQRRDPIAQARQMIEMDPAANWTVECLARSVGMGRSSFAAQFTKEVGQAPMEVVTERRMELAARLLRQGNLKLIEISELAGYASEAAFSRRFSRHFGLAPSQLRHQCRSSESGGLANFGVVRPADTMVGLAGLLLSRPASLRLPVTRPAKASILFGSKR